MLETVRDDVLISSSITVPILGQGLIILIRIVLLTMSRYFIGIGALNSSDTEVRNCKSRLKMGVCTQTSLQLMGSELFALGLISELRK
jgi:hypothetical protein